MECAFCGAEYFMFAESSPKGWFSDPHCGKPLCPLCFKKVVRTYFIEAAAKLGLSFNKDED